MARKSIRSRLMSNFLLVSIIPFSLVFVILYLVVGSSIREEIFGNMEMSREMERRVVEDYFNSYLEELEYFTNGRAHVENMVRFLVAYRNTDFPELSPEQTARLRAHYDSIIPILFKDDEQLRKMDWFPSGKVAQAIQYKFRIDEDAFDLGEYEKIYNQTTTNVILIANKFEVVDAMVVENETGNVIFTLNKGLDLGLHMYDSRYEGGMLRELLQKSMQLPEGSSIMTDLQPYRGDSMEPRVFLAAPMYHEGECIASLVFKLSNAKMEGFMTHEGWTAEGLESTMESYLVGQDRTLRTSSRFYVEDPDRFLKEIEPLVEDSVVRRIEQRQSTIFNLPVKTRAVEDSFDEEESTRIERDYRNVKVITSYTPVTINDNINWALVVQMDYRVAMAPLMRFYILLSIMMIGVVVVVIVMARWSSRKLVEPVNVLMAGTAEVKRDNLDVVLEPVSDDELRTLTEMFNTMVGSIKSNREEITRLYDEVSQKQKDITESIQYALRIQQAALPSRGEIDEVFTDDFILYRPKDIVSGDFYWYHRMEKHFVLVAADCTGHGVPGSFISLLMIRFLRRAVRDERMTDPGQILDRLREEIHSFFEKEDRKEDIRDGMDAAICTYSSEDNTLLYAGAYNPLYLIRDGEVEIIKGDRMAVSAQEEEDHSPFQTHRIKLKEGDTFYVFSDGFPDQLGGPRGKKFMIRKFRELLLEIHRKPMHDQQDILQEKLDQWMEHSEQTDDILVIGFKP